MGFPFGCWRGMIREDDHDLDLQIFRNFQIAIGKFLAATSCSYLQQPSLYPQLPISPSPKSRRPGSRGARWFPLVLHSFMLPHRVNRLSVVPHRRADRSCGSSTLEADWLQLRAASVKIVMQQPRSEVNLYVKF